MTEHAEPLVTVITPCFEHGATLGRALASLVAQTMGDWECVVVDDGSGRSIQPVVEQVGDERIRLIRFNENRGRSAARQAALDQARGRYIAMLDADDWYFPDKLERQVRLLESRPELAAVSCGMAVIDEDDHLVGMRSINPREMIVQTGSRDRMARLPFPPVMLRRERAVAHRFDERLERSEDLDYLMRVLVGHNYGMMPQAGYAYREIYSDVTMGEALIGFRNQRRIYRRELLEHPVKAGRKVFWNLIKTGIYRAARSTGRGKWLFSRRNRPASVEERRAYEEARQRVLEVMARSGLKD